MLFTINKTKMNEFQLLSTACQFVYYFNVSEPITAVNVPISLDK